MTLTANEITRMRGTLDLSLPEMGTIMRRVDTTDGQGGATTTWQAAGTVPARVSPATTRAGVEPRTGGGITSESDWIATLPAGTDIRVTDRLVHHSVTYEVAAADRPRTWDLAVRVDLVRIGGN